LSDQVPLYFGEAGIECVQLDTPGLTLFKAKLEEALKTEAAVLSTIVVEYSCGCTGKGIHAGPVCPVHNQKKIHG